MLSFLLPMLMVIYVICVCCLIFLKDRNGRTQVDDIEQEASLRLQEEQPQGFSDICFRKEEKTECSECVICLTEFREGDKCKVRSNCNHIYHKACVDEWLAKSNQRYCPLCRGPVCTGSPDFLIRIRHVFG